MSHNKKQYSVYQNALSQKSFEQHLIDSPSKSVLNKIKPQEQKNKPPFILSNKFENKYKKIKTPKESTVTEQPIATRNYIKHISNNLSKSIITVDTSKSKSNSEVLKLCLNELGWVDCATGGSNGQPCDIIWQSCTYHENNASELTCNYSVNTTFKINKFPCMNTLLRKGPLTRALNVMRKLYNSEFEFYPRTWFLPEQFKEFSQDVRYIHEKEMKSKQSLFTTFIVKPNDGSQGEGIMLIKDPEDYLKMPKKNSSKSFIVQEYIHNPFLIDGLKFDLRIYVVIVSLKPLEIYICDEGLVRFATVNYQFPNEENLNQIFMHLTNYSLNKKNEMYKFTNNTSSNNNINNNNEAGNGSKRKLTTVFNYMQMKGYNVSRLKASIDDLVVKTVLSLLPEMKVECAFETYNMSSKQRPEYFQVIFII